MAEASKFNLVLLVCMEVFCIKVLAIGTRLMIKRAPYLRGTNRTLQWTIIIRKNRKVVAIEIQTGMARWSLQMHDERVE